MMSRSGLAITWEYTKDVPIAADFYLDVGAENSGFNATGLGTPTGRYLAPIKFLPYFSIDVRTDNVIEIDIETGMLTTTMSVMATLVCGGVLQHNTVYNMPPPFNTSGFLILTGNFCRLRVRNPSGALVTPFEVQARSWNR